MCFPYQMCGRDGVIRGKRQCRKYLTVDVDTSLPGVVLGCVLDQEVRVEEHDEVFGVAVS